MKFNLKKKILVTMFSLGILSLIGTTIASYAIGDTTIKSDGLDVSLNGYIDFVEGPNVQYDRIWMVASISGSNIYLVDNNTNTSCYVIPGTDSVMLSKHYLNSSKKQWYRNQVNCGYGGTRGKLQMKCVDKSYTLYS